MSDIQKGGTNPKPSGPRPERPQQQGAKPMSIQPQCACLHVGYDPTKHMAPNPLKPSLPEVEAKAGRWRCPTCEREFIPKRVADSLAIVVKKSNEDTKLLRASSVAMIDIMVKIQNLLSEAGAPGRPVTEIVERVAFVLEDRKRLMEALNQTSELAIKLQKQAKEDEYQALCLKVAAAFGAPHKDDPDLFTLVDRVAKDYEKQKETLKEAEDWARARPSCGALRGILGVPE